MAGNIIDISKIKQLLQLYLDGVSSRQMGNLIKLSIKNLH